MAQTILGRKVGMTQVWDADDNQVAVTVIEAGPCVVAQVKTAEHDGYDAIQIGFGAKKASKVNKPMAGHFEKAGVEPVRWLREVRLDGPADKAPGDTLTLAEFKDVAKVDVIGTSKGKGYQGTIRRWNFACGPMTHGSRNQRRPGSIGQCAYPGEVRKGLKMTGRMGGDRVTVRNLTVVAVDEERNLILVRGAVPGAKGGLVQIRCA